MSPYRLFMLRSAHDNSPDAVHEDLQRRNEIERPEQLLLDSVRKVWGNGVLDDLLKPTPQEGFSLGMTRPMHERLMQIAYGVKPIMRVATALGEPLLAEPDDGGGARLIPASSRLGQQGDLEFAASETMCLMYHDGLLAGGGVIAGAGGLEHVSPRRAWIADGGQWRPDPQFHRDGKVAGPLAAGPEEVLRVTIEFLRHWQHLSELQLQYLVATLVLPLVCPTRLFQRTRDAQLTDAPLWTVHLGFQLMDHRLQAGLLAIWRIAMWVDEACRDRTGGRTRPRWNVATEGGRNLIGLLRLRGMTISDDPPFAVICRLLHELLHVELFHCPPRSFCVGNLKNKLKEAPDGVLTRLIDAPGLDTLLAATDWLLDHFYDCPRPDQEGRYDDLHARASDRTKNLRGEIKPEGAKTAAAVATRAGRGNVKEDNLLKVWEEGLLEELCSRFGILVSTSVSRAP